MAPRLRKVVTSQPAGMNVIQEFRGDHHYWLPEASNNVRGDILRQRTFQATLMITAMLAVPAAPIAATPIAPVTFVTALSPTKDTGTSGLVHRGIGPDTGGETGKDDKDDNTDSEASDDPGSGGTDENDDNRAATIFNSRQPLSPKRTLRIVGLLENTSETCKRAPDVYQLDCVRAEYERIAARLPKRGDYAPIQQAINGAARELAALSRANRDPSKPRATARLAAAAETGRSRSARFRAIKPSAVPAANAAAARIIGQAQTVLLRSVSNSERRQAHFRDVAQALEGGKLLLRS